MKIIIDIDTDCDNAVEDAIHEQMLMIGDNLPVKVEFDYKVKNLTIYEVKDKENVN